MMAYDQVLDPELNAAAIWQRPGQIPSPLQTMHPDDASMYAVAHGIASRCRVCSGLIVRSRSYLKSQTQLVQPLLHAH